MKKSCKVNQFQSGALWEDIIHVALENTHASNQELMLQ